MLHDEIMKEEADISDLDKIDRFYYLEQTIGLNDFENINANKTSNEIR